MTLSLRQRLFLTLLPILVLLAVLGSAGAVLLYHLGDSINEILRENYDSVRAMWRLNEAVERIDSSFQFALAGQPEKARQQYTESWPAYDQALDKERENITLPGEGALVAELTEQTRHYRRQGDLFIRAMGPAGPAAVVAALALGPLASLPALSEDPGPHHYFGPGGLLERFTQIKTLSGKILSMNQENMEQASHKAQRLARQSLLGFGIGLAAAVILALLLAWNTGRTILRPIRAATDSALAIGAGDLNQLVPVSSDDELGQFADAFNTMARQLRQFRQTNYSQLLTAQRTSQATIDSFPDPVLVVGTEGQIEMANPAARRLFGGAAEGTRAAPIPWQPPEPIRQPIVDALKNQRAYLPEGFDHAIPLSMNGQEHVFVPRILPIRDPYGNTLGAAVLLQDVTSFRLLDQIKTDLVATVSHELKTPLTSIRLAIHLLLEETIGPLAPKQVELLLDARESAEALLAKINHLLNLARLEQGREQIDLLPETPASLLQTAADVIRPRADDKGVTVSVEVEPGLPMVEADAQRLGYALGNLLDNAVTYADAGGRITLSAFREDGGVAFAVADTGRGIPPEHVARIFEKFFRVPGQSVGGGTGLGLAIVREIVTAHGGHIRCESQPGVGTTFRIWLPMAGNPSTSAASAGVSHAQ